MGLALKKDGGGGEIGGWLCFNTLREKVIDPGVISSWLFFFNPPQQTTK